MMNPTFLSRLAAILSTIAGRRANVERERAALLVLWGCFWLGAAIPAYAQAKEQAEITTADGAKLRYVIEGSGIPCVVVNGGHYRGVYSQALRRRLKFIFLEFRHSRESDPPAKLDNITLDTLVDDIEQARRALGFDKIAVIGHSTPAVVAVEYARKYPAHTSHLILIGAAPFSVAPQERETFWAADASDARKLADRRNLARITEEELKNVSPGRAWVLRYVRNGARMWYDPTYDCSWMWEGISPNMAFMRQVRGFMESYDVAQKTPRVTTPVFLALGRYDYGVPYYLWNDKKQLFPNMSYYLFARSGHFPMLEEQTLFDQKLVQWIGQKR